MLYAHSALHPFLMKRWTMGILFFLRKFLRSLRNKNWKCMYINRIGRIPFFRIDPCNSWLSNHVSDTRALQSKTIYNNRKRVYNKLLFLSLSLLYIMSKDTAVCVCEDEHLAVRLEILWRAFTKAFFFLFPLNDLKRNRKKKRQGNPSRPAWAIDSLLKLVPHPKKDLNRLSKLWEKRNFFFDKWRCRYIYTSSRFASR